MNLRVVGVSHHTASVEVREALAVAGELRQEALRRITSLPGVSEAVILSTCNRVEVYLVAEEGVGAEAYIWPLRGARVSALPAGRIRAALYEHAGARAARHLIRVGVGLDAHVLGECQSLGSVEHAYEAAQQLGTTGPILDLLFQRTVRLAKVVRTAAGLSPGESAVARELLSRIMATLEQRAELLVGVGQDTEVLAAPLLEYRWGRLGIARRYPDGVRRIVPPADGTPVTPRRPCAPSHQTGFVLSAGTAEGSPPLAAEACAALRARSGCPLCLLDLSIPRHIEPEASRLPGAYLFAMSDLHEVLARSERARRDEVERGEVFVRQLLAKVWPMIEQRLYEGGHARAHMNLCSIPDP